MIALTAWIKTNATGVIIDRNFGDELSYYLLQAIAQDEVVLEDSPKAETADVHLAFVGSIFHLIQHESVQVWGSGVHAPNMMPKVKLGAILAVRGPLSRDLLKAAGIRCSAVYGDPALLLPYLFTPRPRRHFKLGLIAHFHDQDLPHVKAFAAAHPEVCFIQMGGYGDWHDVVRAICSCDLVLSSSLHGMVVADAYGIPNLFVRLSDIPIGGEFKFQDYCAGVGRDYVPPLNFREKVDLAQVDAANYHAPAAIDMKAFVETCPIALRPDFVVRVKKGEKPPQEPVPPPRVLFASNTPNRMNPFVNIIADKLARLGCTVKTGVNEFWICSPSDYDILQFEWPEDLVRWKLAELTDGQLGTLKQRLAAFQTAGCKICYTRHNTLPHNVKTNRTARLYHMVEDAADAIFHMAEYSRKEFLASRSSDSRKRHIIIPHHIYDDIDRTVPQAQARRRLGIDPEAKVVLVFGAFRNDAEKKLTCDAVAKCKAPRLMLLAPQLKGGRVPDEELPDYFSAADVVFIQRPRILNSGNLPMAFYFGKVVVGPAIGNVGEILKKTKNPTFDPSDPASAAVAIEEGFRCVDKKRGERNRRLADRAWTPSLVARQMLDAYGQLLDADFSFLPRRAPLAPTGKMAVPPQNVYEMDLKLKLDAAWAERRRLMEKQQPLRLKVKELREGLARAKKSVAEERERKQALLAKVAELRTGLVNASSGLKKAREQSAAYNAKIEELRASIKGYKKALEISRTKLRSKPGMVTEHE